MISGMRLKIVVIAMIISIISASAYYYLETKNEPKSNNENGSENKTKKEMTLLEALNLAEEEMNKTYSGYNLSLGMGPRIWDEPQYRCSFLFYFVKDCDNKTILQIPVTVVFKGSTWSVDVATPNKLGKPSPHWWFYTDVRGFDPKLVKIDSDKAVEIIKRVAEERNVSGSFSLLLKNNYLIPATPMWCGYFNSSFFVKVNAATGEVMDSYYRLNSEKNVYIDNISNTFNGSRFTFLKGLGLSNYYMSLKYINFNLTEIKHEETENGYSSFWEFTYIVVHPVREFIWETVTVYANGTLSSENRTMEIEEFNTLHGLRDVWGFDPNLLQIDSNEAINIIYNYAINESWYENTTRFELNFEKKHDPEYYSVTPEWIGEFFAGGKVHSFYINATTGELIETTEQNAINITTRSLIDIENKVSAVNRIGESNLSEVVSIEISKEKENGTSSLDFLWIIGALTFIMVINHRRKKRNGG